MHCLYQIVKDQVGHIILPGIDKLAGYDFGIGMTSAYFQSSGKTPLNNELLEIIKRGIATKGASGFNKTIVILSGLFFN